MQRRFFRENADTVGTSASLADDSSARATLLEEASFVKHLMQPSDPFHRYVVALAQRAFAVKEIPVESEAVVAHQRPCIRAFPDTDAYLQLLDFFVPDVEHFVGHCFDLVLLNSTDDYFLAACFHLVSLITIKFKVSCNRLIKETKSLRAGGRLGGCCFVSSFLWQHWADKLGAAAPSHCADRVVNELNVRRVGTVEAKKFDAE